MKRSMKLGLKKVLSFFMVAVLLTGMFSLPALADVPPPGQLEETDIIQTDGILSDDDTDLDDDDLDDDDLDDDSDDLDNDLIDDLDSDFLGINAMSQMFAPFAAGTGTATAITSLVYHFTVTGVTGETSVTLAGGPSGNRTLSISGDNDYTLEMVPSGTVTGIDNLGYRNTTVGAGFNMRLTSIVVNGTYTLPVPNGANSTLITSTADGLPNKWNSNYQIDQFFPSAGNDAWLGFDSTADKIVFYVDESGGGGGGQTYKASLIGQMNTSYLGGLTEWPAAGAMGEVEFEIGKEATFSYNFASPARFNNFARIVTDFPLDQANTTKTVITSIKVNGTDVPLTDIATVNGEGWTNNHVALNLFNNWNANANDAVNVASFTSTSMNSIEIKFIVYDTTETFKASLIGQMNTSYLGGLTEWPAAGAMGEVEFELGKEATFSYNFASPARFNNFARIVTDVPLDRTDAMQTVITSIKVNGTDVPLTDTATINGEGWTANHAALNIYNNWNANANDAVNVASFTSTSMNTIEIKFIVYEANPNATDAYLIFADGSWDTEWWGPGNGANSANVTPTLADVDSFGTYTTKLDFTAPVNGIEVFALEITDGETLFPNNFMTIDEVKVNGTAVPVDLTYTTANNDDSRTNLHNKTVASLPAQFRTADGDDNGVTWLAIDVPGVPISSLEVTFTLDQGYLIGQGPPKYQDFPDLKHIKPIPGAKAVTRIEYEFLVKQVDENVNFNFAARFGNWTERTSALSLVTGDVGTTKTFAVTFTGQGASDFISLGDLGDATRGVAMDLTKMTVRTGTGGSAVDYVFTFDGSPYDARILRSNNLHGPHNIANGWRNEVPGTVLFVDDSGEMCFVMQDGGQAGKQITLQAVAAAEEPLPVNIKDLVYNFGITGIGAETGLTFKAQTGRGSWYERIMDLTTASGGEISVDMSPAVDTVAMLDMGYITNNLPSSNIELTLKSVVINGLTLEFEPGDEPVIKPKAGENRLPNIWTADGTIAATSAYGDHSDSKGGAIGEAALVKPTADQRISFFIRGGDDAFVPVDITGSVMKTSRSHDYTTAMGVGWNLGNSFDATGGTSLDGTNPWEESWGNPRVTQAFIQGIKAKGYDHIRLPFTIGNSATRPFTDKGAATPDDELRYVIDPAYLARYKEVVQWAIDAGLYVMVNIHHDSWQWLGRSGNWNGDLTDWRYRRFRDHWTELAQLFADIDSDLLMFETINEPEFDAIGMSPLDKLSLINSAAIEIIRATPGLENKIIVLPTYITNHSDSYCTSLLTHIAELEDENLIATVHYYSEWVFSQDLGIRLFDEDCGFEDRPGVTPRSSIDDLHDTLNHFFVDYGIGVNIGEWGLLTYDRQNDWQQQGEELKYYEYFHHMAKHNGTSVTFWDNNSGIHRGTGAWRKPIIGALLESSAQGIRSATSKGLDTLYFDKAATQNVNIELLLNGRTFTGIAGLTEGTDYTYSQASATVILRQAYVNAKFNARANTYGIFDTLRLQFDDGEDWHQYLVAYDAPSYESASGTRNDGIRINFDFRGDSVMRVYARDSSDRWVGGGNSGWWRYLELGALSLNSTDGAFRVTMPSGGNTTGAVALNRGFFSDNNANGDITVYVEFFSGRIVAIPMNIAGTASSSAATVVGYDPLQPICAEPGCDEDTDLCEICSKCPLHCTHILRTRRSFNYANAMGDGWNLGNTFDGFDTAFSIAELGGGETAWGNPKTERNLIKFIKESGFKHIRIPMTADLRFTDNGSATPAGEYRYVLSPAWLARYREVVQWSLDEGLYVMLNLHHDSWRWINYYDPAITEQTFTNDGTTYTDFDVLRAYSDLWKQLSAYFADMDDKVMFETINEPQFRIAGSAAKQACLDELNRVAFDIIRATPGNENRMIVIPTMSTNHGNTQSTAARNLIASLDDENILATVHYYHNNWDFSANLGNTMYNSTNRNQTTSDFNAIQTRLLDYGIGVSIGEWGLLAYDEGWPDFDGHLQLGEELKYYAHVKELSMTMDGLSMSFWDNGSGIDRWMGEARNSPPRTSNFVWRIPRVGAMIGSNEKSSFVTDLDTAFYREEAAGDLSIPLTLNGNLFIGIKGLTSGVDYTYDSGVVTLKEAYINSKFNSFDGFGVFDTLVIQFSGGNDWEYYLRKVGVPVVFAATGTLDTGITIPMDFRGNRVNYVRAFNQSGARIGPNTWATGLQYAGGGYQLDYKADSSSITHGQWFFDDGSIPAGPDAINMQITFFDGQVITYTLFINDTDDVSVMVVGPPDNSTPGDIIDIGWLENEVQHAEEDQESLPGNAILDLDIFDILDEGDGWVISKETLINIRSTEGVGTTINIDLFGGIILSIDTTKISVNDNEVKDFNLFFHYTLASPDTAIYIDQDLTKGIIADEYSLIIYPAVTGEFGLEVVVIVNDSILTDWDIIGDPVNLFYIDSNGKHTFIEALDRAFDGSVSFVMTKASSYLLTDATSLEEFPYVAPQKPETKPNPESQPSGSSSAPSAPATVTPKAAPIAPAKTIYVVTANLLNERTGPGTNFPRVGTLRNGTVLEIVEFSPDGRWALAHTGTWVSVQYLRHLSGPVRPIADPAATLALSKTTKYSVDVRQASRLFVRSTSGMQGRIVGTLRRGDIVNVIEIKNGWATIAYTKDVPIAYVSVQYLKLLATQ